MTKPAIAIIQARCSSKRLPNKVLKPLSGKPMIWHIVQRAKACVSVEDVIVATSKEESDNKLYKFCIDNGIKVYRGSLNNVLDRFVKILRKHGSDYFVRITGDCPLIHPPFIDKQVEALKRYNADFIKICGPSPTLDGQGVRSVKSLFDVASKTNHKDDLEHVGSRYLTENIQEYRVVKFIMPDDLKSAYKVSVDQPEDYRLMSILYNELFHEKPIELFDALNWLDKNPELAKINNCVKESKINIELQKQGTKPVDFCGTVHW